MALPYSAPTAELAVELSEVRTDAAALADILFQLNAPLPKDFPVEAVLELANALRELPDGTGRGCLRPLNEAQSQLATVRSQHIRHDDHSEQNWDEERPPLFRGEPVDQRLRSLMSSVSTALQTANRLAAEEFEPDLPEPESSPLSASITAKLIESSSKAQTELEDERSELDSLNLKSEPADTLNRRLTDALVLNRLGRSELRLPRIMSARLRRIGATLRDYPALLEKAAELISIGADVADYAHEKWATLQTRIFEAGTRTVREIADDISNYARKLEAIRKAPDTLLPDQPPQDFDLEEVASMVHAGIAPPANWRPYIETLPLGNRRLKSLSPLVGFKHLREFTKASVKVSDISPLRDLTSLEILLLDGTNISDLKPLSQLTSLEQLGLDFTPVNNLTPLSKLINLRTLSLNSTKVSELAPLAEMRNLQRLRLMRTSVSDLSSLKNFHDLRFLDLDSTGVIDIQPLQNLTHLESLDLSRTKVTNLAPIASLTSLQSLHLDNMPVIDLSPLVRLTKLQYLFLNDCKATEFASLAGLTNLQHLSLVGSNIADLEPISKLTELRSLSLDRTRISSITSLQRLKKLRHLALSHTAVSEVQALENLEELTSLIATNTKVSSFLPLAKLRHLSYISISKDMNVEIEPELKRSGLTITLRDK